MTAIHLQPHQGAAIRHPKEMPYPVCRSKCMRRRLSFMLKAEQAWHSLRVIAAEGNATGEECIASLPRSIK